MSEDTGVFLQCQNEYSKSLSWAENLNKLFTVLGGKFKFSAQDSDLEYLCWRCKHSLVYSYWKPPLVKGFVWSGVWAFQPLNIDGKGFQFFKTIAITNPTDQY